MILMIMTINENNNKQCENCKYYGRDYENNDVFCNNYKSKMFRECVALEDSCNKWEPKE